MGRLPDMHDNRAKRNIKILEKCNEEIEYYPESVSVETLYEDEIIIRYNRYVKKLRKNQNGV